MTEFPWVVLLAILLVVILLWFPAMVPGNKSCTGKCECRMLCNQSNGTMYDYDSGSIYKNNRCMCKYPDGIRMLYG